MSSNRSRHTEALRTEENSVRTELNEAMTNVLSGHRADVVAIGATIGDYVTFAGEPGAARASLAFPDGHAGS